MTWSPRNRCGERKDSEGYSDDEDGDEDEEDNNDDLAEERENFSRKTTVIKTPQGTQYGQLYRCRLQCVQGTFG